MTVAAIGLGSNLGDPSRTLRRAVAGLARLGRVRAVSSFYRTRAWGLTSQPDFVNAAALLETTLGPLPLLRALKRIEAMLGRVPGERWGPRVVDLDILTYGSRRVVLPHLRIPHARLYDRAFALAPLAEIDARFAAALAALPAEERGGVERIGVAGARSRGAVEWDETLARVREAADFCAASGLARFRVADERVEIEVRRTPRAAVSDAGQDDDAAALLQGGAASPNGHIPVQPATVLKAEFVGIVRFARPAVAPGSPVAEDRELAFVEALGIRNPVRTPVAGRVEAVYVTDGQAVEYGQPLFAIDVP